MSDSREVMIAEILGYLLDHPDAKDTAAGIAGWWLRADYSGPGEADVKAVLAELVECEWLRVWEAGSSGPIYGLKEGKLQAVRDFLGTQHRIN